MKTHLNWVLILLFMLCGISEIFAQTNLDIATESAKNSFPFDRIALFGDSLSDNGNLYARAGVPAWPYWQGRFSNGPVWIENIVAKLNQREISQKFVMRNYAEGGSGALTFGFNPYKLSDQVRTYFKEMRQQEEDGGANANPSYDKTLFVLFSGSNDYLSLAYEGCAIKHKACGDMCPLFGCDYSPVLEQCASACAMGVVNAISEQVTKIIHETAKRNNEKAKYFLIPNEPEIALAPLYNNSMFPWQPTSILQFVTTVSIAHNMYLSMAVKNLESVNPGTKIMSFDTYTLMDNAIRNPNDPMMLASGITNKTESCLVDISPDETLVCADPQSYFFWDVEHPTATVHCNIAQVGLAEMYKNFSNGQTYTPDYASCRVKSLDSES